jgi:hypothetical protein
LWRFGQSGWHQSGIDFHFSQTQGFPSLGPQLAVTSSDRPGSRPWFHRFRVPQFFVAETLEPYSEFQQWNLRSRIAQSSNSALETREKEKGQIVV